MLEGPVEERSELSAEQVFAEACALAWSDGGLEERELKILTGLAAAIRIDADTAKGILDETFEDSMAAMQAGAAAAKAEAAAQAKAAAQAEPPPEEPKPPEPAKPKKPAKKKPPAKATEPKKPPPSSPSRSSRGLGLIPELVTGLFTEPLETLARAAEPECRVATLVIGAVGVLLPAALSPIAQIDAKIALVHEASSFAISYLGILVGGRATGGKGDPLPLLQMLCLVAPVLGGASALLGVAGLGWVVSLFGLVLYYYLMKLGHGFGDLRDMMFAYAVGFALMIFLFVGQSKVISAMVEAARPSGYYY